MKSMMTLLCALVTSVAPGLTAWAGSIVHDAEYYILEAQHGKKWAAEDKNVESKLAEIRKKHGGKPPNILYILVDDVGFGELGNRTLNYVRGYETPRINKFAEEGLRFMRMYTEPSCTPTRIAFMTGRIPSRTGMDEAKAALAGEGLAAKEVTLAEILSQAGYSTVHIGKWHMGDVEEAYPNNQGFDFAAFPLHQQGQLSLMHYDAEIAGQLIGRDDRSYDNTFTLDRYFRINPSAMVTGVEGYKNKPVREIDLKPGEEWTQAKYNRMNERYQRQTIEWLRKLAKAPKPFFLQYWPLVPLTFTRIDIKQAKTLNGGSQVESMKKLDGWIGDILDELDRLGVAENTVVVIMGDNGIFKQYQPYTGYSPMIYRGGKADTTEGGVRVDAFARWPGVIEADSYAGDIIHVSDLFTTFARIAGANPNVPTDRVIDGLDQTALLLLGETHGRRDSVFIYAGPVLKAVVKEHIKLEMPKPGENIIGAKFYNLYRDPREEFPVSTQVGVWAGASFQDIIVRHMMMKKKYPDWSKARGRPYTGIKNLRPESMDLVQFFMSWHQPKP